MDNGNMVEDEERHYCGLLTTSVTRQGCRGVKAFDKKEYADISPGCCDCAWDNEDKTKEG